MTRTERAGPVAVVEPAPGPPAGRTASGAAAQMLGWLRGEPLHVPSHALVVHFPAALLPTSLVVDVVGRADPALGLGRTASVMLVAGLAGGAAAAVTGLLDWIRMLPGPRRSRVTRHLLLQVGALLAFGLSLVVRAAAPDSPASTPALALSLAGTLPLTLGNHLGGLLVYRDGLRVRSSRPG